MKFQSNFGQKRGNEIETQEAEQTADKACNDRRTQGPACLSAHCHRVTIDRGRRCGGSTRNIQQYGGKTPSHHPTDIQAQ